MGEHYRHGTITSTTGWPHVEMGWKNMKFERSGGVAFNEQNFPEAAFWFFQHQMHRLNGIHYSNVGLSVQNAGKEWKGFDEFLMVQYNKKKILPETKWSTVQNDWAKFKQ